MNNEPESQQDPIEPTPTPTPTPISAPTPEPAATPPPELSDRDRDFGIKQLPTPIPNQTITPLEAPEAFPTPETTTSSFAPLPYISDESKLPSEPTKKSHKKAIVISLVALLLIGAAVASYFIFFQPKTTTTATVPSNEKVEEVKPDTYDSQSLIEEVRIAQAKLTDTYPQSETTSGETNFSPAYKYGDAAYYVRGNFGESVSVLNTTATELSELSTDPLTKAAVAAAVAVLDSHTSLIKTSSSSLTIYQSDTAVCTVTTVDHPVVTTCADTKMYKIEAEKIKPFAEAYAKVTESEEVSKTVFTRPAITEKSDGYANASVSMSGVDTIGGFAGLYYAKGGVWTYWKGSQELIECSEYSTFVLQKAFEGTRCYDSTIENDATVVVTLSE